MDPRTWIEHRAWAACVGMVVLNVAVPVGLAVLAFYGVRAATETEAIGGLCQQHVNFPQGRPSLAAARTTATKDLATKNSALVRARERLRLAQTPQERTARQAAVTKLEQQTSGVKATLSRLKVIPTSLPEGAVTSFGLGNDVNAGPRHVTFTLATPVAADRRGLTIAVSAFTPTESGPEIPRAAVQAWAFVNADLKTASAYFCLRPEVRSKVPSGTFNGQLIVNDSRVAPLVIPVTISTSYTQRHIVVFVGIAVCLLTSLYTFLLRSPRRTVRPGQDEGSSDDTEVSDPNTTVPAPGYATSVAEIEDGPILRWNFQFFVDYYRFVTSTQGVVTMVVGFAAAVTAFTAQYLSAEAWDPSLQGWLTYAGAIGTAFLAGGTAGKLLQIQPTTSTDARSHRRRRRRHGAAR